MTSIYDILRRPIITEKSNYQTTALNQVVFEVAGRCYEGKRKGCC